MEQINIGNPRRFDDRKSIFQQCNDAMNEIWGLLSRLSTKLYNDYPDNETTRKLIANATGAFPGLTGTPEQVVFANAVDATYVTSGESIVGNLIIPKLYFDGGRCIEIHIDCYGHTSGGSAPIINLGISANGVAGLNEAIQIRDNCELRLRYSRSDTHVSLTTVVLEYDTPVQQLQRFVTSSVDAMSEVELTVTTQADSTNYLQVFSVQVRSIGKLS